MRNLSLAVVAALFFLGVIVSTMALYFGVAILGPVTRFLIGQPFAFGEDYGTIETWAQAFLVQLTSLVLFFSIACLLVGRLLNAVTPVRAALIAANPVTIGIGFSIYGELWAGEFTAEYFVPLSWISLATVAPVAVIAILLSVSRWGRRT